MYSEEQSNYVTSTDVSIDTKLLAVAGSGKTRCIIGRMQFMIEVMKLAPQSILMLTFSKNAQQDFKRKVRKAKIETIELNNICTIDSLARRSLLQISDDSTDVSLLSYTFLIHLQTCSKDEISKFNPTLCETRHVFVDEAQDLNSTQHSILMLMRDKFALNLHMVGDPSQNIFQFRRSSDRYLSEFEARTFQLTINFRSCPQIVNFATHLRASTGENTVCAKPITKSVVKIVSVRDNSDFECTILGLLDRYKSLNIPLEKCAIMSPTRGKIRDSKGLPSYVGLCYIANLLFQHNIEFSQFYNESSSGSKIKYKPIKGRVNLTTYHGSKGLEWNNVIVIDANAYLVSRYGYTVNDFVAEQYLLYVACSRASQNMVIVTKAGMASPWFEPIPRHLFFSTGLSLKIFDRKRLEFKPARIELTSVTKTIANLDEAQLYELSKIVANCIDMQSSDMDIGWGTATMADESKCMLLGCVMENYFLICSSNDLLPHLFADVERVLANRNVLVCCDDRVARWFFENKEIFDWNLFDKVCLENTVLTHVRTFVDQNFDREVCFRSHTIVDKFYHHYITQNLDMIRECRDRYNNNCRDFIAVLDMSAINYAISTSNYFLITQIECIRKKVCSESVIDVAANVRLYCESNMIGKIAKTQITVCNDTLQGIVDFIDTCDVTCEIKCVKNVTLSHVLQVFMYDALRRRSREISGISEIAEETFVIYNLYNGIKHTYTANVDSISRTRLLAILTV